MGNNVKRLIKELIPKTYDIVLDLDAEKLKYSGSLRMEATKIKKDNKIRLHLNNSDLKLKSSKVLDNSNKETKVLKEEFLKDAQELVLTLDEKIKGDLTVEFTFESKITESLTGLYPGYYKNNSQEEILLTTQFESHHAREVFPLIDEPEAKAIFKVTLISSEKNINLSNMSVKNESIKDGKRITEFNDSPKMSSYLLAFISGDFHYVEDETKNGVKVRVYATKNHEKAKLLNALHVATKSVEYFEDYFGVKYPLDKIDHVAIPDFDAGAMENWGLITYRERLLVLDQKMVSKETLEFSALVIAHETSHQWFGNLVTMKWWDNLWLNESFANLMEYQCVDAIYPKWNVTNKFLSEEGIMSLTRDSIENVQPVQLPVSHPDEISSLFDPYITYAKGGSVLYMLKKYIGEKAFKEGLTSYFNEFKYKNTTGDDLWDAFSMASGKDIKSLMSNWVLSPGFPILEIKKLDNNEVLVSQKPFNDGSKTKLWNVPLFTNYPVKEDLLDRESITIKQEKEPLIFNYGFSGHYLVDYKDEDTKRYIEGKIQNKELPIIDRLFYLESKLLLSKNNKIPFKEVLDILSLYSDEDDEAVWTAILGAISTANQFKTIEPELKQKIEKYADNITSKKLSELTWEENEKDSLNIKKLRTILISLSLFSKNENSLKKAKELFVVYRDKKDPIRPDIVAYVLRAIIESKEDGAFDFLLNEYKTTKDIQLKEEIVKALTASMDEKHVDYLLGLLKDRKIIKSQDLIRWLRFLFGNLSAKNRVWSWMKENWQYLESVLQKDKSFDYIPDIASLYVYNKKEAKEYKEFFKGKRNILALKRNIDINFKIIENRVLFIENNLKDVQEVFEVD